MARSEEFNALAVRVAKDSSLIVDVSVDAGGLPVLLARHSDRWRRYDTGQVKVGLRNDVVLFGFAACAAATRIAGAVPGALWHTALGCWTLPVAQLDGLLAALPAISKQTTDIRRNAAVRH